MDNVVIYVYAKFGDDRLWNEKALAYRKSDNNNTNKKKKKNSNKNIVGGHWGPAYGSNKIKHRLRNVSAGATAIVDHCDRLGTQEQESPADAMLSARQCCHLTNKFEVFLCSCDRAIEALTCAATYRKR